MTTSAPPVKSSREIELWQVRAQLARVDKWAFLKYFVYTKDEHDSTTLAKAFPLHAYLRVLERLVREFDVFYLEKSRQLKISWFFAAIGLHEAMFKKSRLIADQSENQGKANALLNRQRHIYEQLLEFAKLFEVSGEFPYAKMNGFKIGTDDKLEFPLTKSEIVAVPQGEDVVRSYTWSWIFADEINHQPKSAEGFAASMPSISGGGRWSGVGTPNGRTWGYYVREGCDYQTGKKLGRNEIDSDKSEKVLAPPDDISPEEKRFWIENQLLSMPQEEFDAIPITELVASCPGMRVWQNENGIACIRIHYSADPAKDPATAGGKLWYERERRNYTQSQWEREYEIRYDTFEGRPVISNWRSPLHVGEPEYDGNAMLHLSLDFGTQVCGCVFAQYKKISEFSVNRLSILDELILKDMNTHDLAAAVMDLLKSKYRRSWENNNVRVYCDPAGNIGEATSDKSLNTSIKILNSVGLFPRTRKFGVPESTEVLETVFALILPDNRPAVEIHRGCDYLIGCLGGGLHYPTNGRPGYYEKDGWWDHGGDIMRYLICNVFDYDELAPKGSRGVERKKFIPVRRKYTGQIRGYRPRNRISNRFAKTGTRFKP